MNEIEAKRLWEKQWQTTEAMKEKAKDYIDPLPKARTIKEQYNETLANFFKQNKVANIEEYLEDNLDDILDRTCGKYEKVYYRSTVFIENKKGYPVFYIEREEESSILADTQYRVYRLKVDVDNSNRILFNKENEIVWKVDSLTYKAFEKLLKDRLNKAKLKQAKNLKPCEVCGKKKKVQVRWDPFLEEIWSERKLLVSCKHCYLERTYEI